MATTLISTESARPSLAQTLEQLYAQMRTGGAYDTKKELVTNGTHNEANSNLQERIHTVKGFKTKMSEHQTEFFMGLDNKVVTTRMRTSVNGALSTQKYKP